jgi:hypothetical protein
MMRLLTLTILATFGIAAQTQACSVAGTAYDAHGKPMRDAVVRLVNPDGGQAAYALTDANASYRLSADAAGAAFRLDLLSSPTEVTGSHIRTRSILGMSPVFACGSGAVAQQDVHMLVD